MSRVAIPIILSLLLLGCRGGESSAEIEKVTKETIEAIRTREIVKVQVRLEKSEPPNATELAIRKRIEERIESEQVGAIVQTTTDIGHYDFTLEVDSTNDAIPKVRTILREEGVLEQSTVRVEGKAE